MYPFKDTKRWLSENRFCLCRSDPTVEGSPRWGRSLVTTPELGRADGGHPPDRLSSSPISRGWGTYVTLGVPLRVFMNTIPSPLRPHLSTPGTSVVLNPYTKLKMYGTNLKWHLDTECSLHPVNPGNTEVYRKDVASERGEEQSEVDLCTISKDNRTCRDSETRGKGTY